MVYHLYETELQLSLSEINEVRLFFLIMSSLTHLKD